MLSEQCNRTSSARTIPLNTSAKRVHDTPVPCWRCSLVLWQQPRNDVFVFAYACVPVCLLSFLRVCANTCWCIVCMFGNICAHLCLCVCVSAHTFICVCIFVSMCVFPFVFCVHLFVRVLLCVSVCLWVKISNSELDWTVRNSDKGINHI
jgi:hypothetical protein